MNMERRYIVKHEESSPSKQSSKPEFLQSRLNCYVYASKTSRKKNKYSYATNSNKIQKLISIIPLFLFMIYIQNMFFFCNVKVHM